MKLSIVISYFNRRRLLFNTLNTLNHFKGEYPIETIIVDDASHEDQQVDDFPGLFPNLNINLLVIKREDNSWRDTVTAYNTGFNVITGDMVLINCAEVLHLGDIIGYIFNYFESKSYVSFATYSIDTFFLEKLNELDWSKKEVIEEIKNIIQPTHKMPEPWRDCNTGWYSHSIHNNTLAPFCAVISREDLESLSGFDERFGVGIGHADYEFIDRVENLGLKTKLIDDPFCIHQPHTPTVYEEKRTTMNMNLILHLRETKTTRTKADENKIYVR
jgi:glycosyltransferase involved in cell wall biosynthesis